MSKKEEISKFENLKKRAVSGDLISIKKLIETSDATGKDTAEAADLFYKGKGAILPDSKVAYALYYIAASNGDQHSKEILSENSAFDIDAFYYYDMLTSGKDTASKISDLIDVNETVKNISQTMPSSPMKELEEEVEKHKKKRDELNNKAKEWIEKRNELNAQVRDLLTEANKHKAKRDEINKTVKEYKSLRDDANREVSELIEEIRNMRENPNSLNGKDIVNLNHLKNELTNLRIKQQTYVLKKKEEEALMARLAEIESQINRLKRKSDSAVSIREKQEQISAARDRSERYHKLMSERAEEGQAEHEAMVEIYSRIDEIRKEADEAQKKFVECKKKSDEEHKKFVEALNKLNAPYRN